MTNEIIVFTVLFFLVCVSSLITLIRKRKRMLKSKQIPVLETSVVKEDLDEFETIPL